MLPENFEDADHIDTSAFSEIIFGDAASDSGSSTPNWDHDSATCTNVYCHGAFSFKKDDSPNSWAYAFGETEIRGNNPSMTWTQVGTGQAECGTCHSLPPQGHIGSSELNCSLCHGNVVDENKNIIDKSLHINGQLDIRLPANIEQILESQNIKR